MKVNSSKLLSGKTGRAGPFVTRLACYGHCLKRTGLRLGPIEILLVEPLMPVVQRGQLAADEDVFDFGRYVERVAIGDDDVCDFADLELTDLIGEAKHLRRIERDRFKTVF